MGSEDQHQDSIEPTAVEPDEHDESQPPAERPAPDHSPEWLANKSQAAAKIKAMFHS